MNFKKTRGLEKKSYSKPLVPHPKGTNRKRQVEPFAQPFIRKKKPPVWFSFTSRHKAFVLKARELSEALTRNFGPSVTISYFEQFLQEFTQLSDEQKAQIADVKEILQLYQAYQQCHKQREEERQSFRTTVSIKSILAQGIEELQNGISQVDLKVNDEDVA